MAARRLDEARVRRRVRPASAAASAAASAPSLALEGVVKRYGQRTVLNGITLAVRPGELVALLGPNGAGKTTAVEILEGYRAADAGRVTVLGQDPRHGGPALKARVGLMLQDGGLDPRSTPRDLVRLYAGLYAVVEEGASRPAQRPDPAAALEAAGLTAVAGSPIRRLSGGERQRLALALAVIGDPEVILLDEPTAGMDPEARRAARQRIAGWRDAGVAILMTTHDLGDVEQLADRVLILNEGRIVAEGPPDAIGGGGTTGLSIRSGGPLSATAIADLTARISAWSVEMGVAPLEVRPTGGSLEDRYLALTRDSGVEHGA